MSSHSIIDRCSDATRQQHQVTHRTRAVNLATYLRHTARQHPDHPAMIAGQRSLTWREFDTGVDALARELVRRGLGPGDPVMLLSRNSIEQVQTMFALWRVGAVLVPVNFRSSAEEVAGMARTARATLLIAMAEFDEHARAVEATGLLRHGTLTLDDGVDEILGRPAEPFEAAAVDQDSPAWYFFTSGTSGSPKAAVLTHHTLGYIITNRHADLVPATTQHDVSLVIAPLSHGAGTHLLCQVARGATSVLAQAKPMDPREIWRLVAEHGVTNMFLVPTILKRLTEDESVAEYDHSSLRYVLYGGAPITMKDRERARAVLGNKLVQYYGMAEVTGCMTVLTPEGHDLDLASASGGGSAGFPRLGVELSIQDDDGNPLPAGARGNICAAGLPVFAGYLNNDSANDAAFRNGWFWTGDIGYLDESGALYITGRASDMYISGGHNVYPREIEEALAQHPDLDEVAIVGIPDEDWGEIGVAVCAAKAGRTATPDSVTTWLAERLAAYKLPRRVVFWEALPKTAYGKVSKKELRELLQAGERP